MKPALTTLPARERIIVALDLPAERDALQMVETLADTVSWYKIGLQLYTAAGPSVLRNVAATGAKVFLDLKLHDIPNTVRKTVASAAELGVQMLTIHLSGGRAMIEAATAAQGNDLMILGVTVLTSFDAEKLQEIGVGVPLEGHVVNLAKLGAECGIRGVVASWHELSALRATLGNHMTIVTPGIRPEWTEAGDQKRFATPRQAVESGADYLVIGRPITSHSRPREAFERIVREIEEEV